MGLTRKFLSVSTLGIIDFRSDKERVARSARLTKRATKSGNRERKRQTKLLEQQVKLTRRVANTPPPTVVVNPSSHAPMVGGRPAAVVQQQQQYSPPPVGQWVAVALPGGASRQDWVPAEQPPSPDGSHGWWHVVSDQAVPRWEWHPRN